MQSVDALHDPPIPDTEVASGLEDYEHKACRLRALILDATGKDISSLPESVKKRLDALAHTAAILGLDGPSDLAYSAAMSKLSIERSQMQLCLIHLKKVERELRECILETMHRQRLVSSWPKQADLETDTASLERQRRATTGKAKEYQEELSTITSQNPSEQQKDPTVTSILNLETNLREKERDLKVLKARLDAFEGLPPNLELAKQELQIARDNQIRLLNTREKLLGRMTLGLN